MESDKLLNFNVGEIGQKKSWVPPDNLLKEWAPSGLSLEEIEKRREVLRKIQREINIDIANFAKTISPVGTALFTARTVPKNRTYYIYAISIQALHTDTGTANFPYISIQTWANGAVKDEIYATILPFHVAGAAYEAVNSSLTLNYPFPVKENESIVFGHGNFSGKYSLQIYYWSEDKDIIL